MKHLSTFENWRDSEKLNKLNRLTGLFDNGPICEVENGDDYGLIDKYVKMHVIKCGDEVIQFEKITGEMTDEICDLEIRTSDGKKFIIDAFFYVGPPSPNAKKSYFTISCEDQHIKIDPEFALEDIISNFGNGAHLLFVMAFYPNCEMYYNDEAVVIPDFKMV